MRLLIPSMLACLAAGVVDAREVVRFDEADHHADYLAAMTRAVGALPIDPKDGDQARVWFNDPMGRSARGYIFLDLVAGAYYKKND